MIYFVTALEDPSWWGLAGRQYLLALIAAKADVRFLPLNGNVGFDPTQIDPEFTPILERFGGGVGDVEGTIVHGPLDQLAGRALISPDLIGPRDIALTSWPEATIPEEFVSGLQAYEEIWVPSKFAETAFVSAGLSNVQVVWTPLNLSLWAKVESRRPEDKFVFYAVGEWAGSDSVELVARAFLQEFRRDEKVLLHLICPDTPLLTPQAIAGFASVNDARELPLLSVDSTIGRALEKSPAQWRIVHKCCHCYVTASGRSDLDPWSLGAAAAGNILCGTPAQYGALEEDPAGQTTLDIAEYQNQRVDIDELKGAMRAAFEQKPTTLSLGPQRMPSTAGSAMLRLITTLGDRTAAQVVAPTTETHETSSKKSVRASKIGVIIPHKDRGLAWLETVWATLKDQLQPDDFFIVSDQESSPETLRVIEDFVLKNRGTLVRSTPPECGWSAALARNAGARVANDMGAELLFFLDADALLLPGAVDNLALVLEGKHPRINAADMAVPMVLQGEKFLAPAELPQKKWQVPEDVQARYGSGSSMFRAEDIMKVGGYDESYMGWGSEDIDLLARLEAMGRKRVANPEVVLYHQPHEESPYKAEWGAKNQEKSLAVMKCKGPVKVNESGWGLGRVVILSGERL